MCSHFGALPPEREPCGAKETCVGAYGKGEASESDLIRHLVARVIVARPEWMWVFTPLTLNTGLTGTEAIDNAGKHVLGSMAHYCLYRLLAGWPAAWARKKETDACH